MSDQFESVLAQFSNAEADDAMAVFANMVVRVQRRPGLGLGAEGGAAVAWRFPGTDCGVSLALEDYGDQTRLESVADIVFLSDDPADFRIVGEVDDVTNWADTNKLANKLAQACAQALSE